MAVASSKTRAAVAVAVAVLVVGLGLTLCTSRQAGTGPDPATPGAPGTGTSATSAASGPADPPPRREADGITAALLGRGREKGDEPALASATGMVDTYNDLARMLPAVAEIIAVEAEGASLLLRWRLKSAGETLRLRATTFSGDSPSFQATEVAMVSPAGQESARPYRTDQGCICSSVPTDVDTTGQAMSGLYPMFSAVPAEVEIRIPGFPPIGGVPVTRR